MATSAFLSITETSAAGHVRNYRSSEAGLAQTALYAMMGTALGLLTGIAAASGPWSANTVVMANNSTVASHKTVPSTVPSFHPTVQTAVVQHQDVEAAPAPVLVRASLPVSHAHAQTSTTHHVSAKSNIVNAVVAAAPVAAKPEAAAVPAVASTVNADVAAPSEAVTKPAMMMIEGDLTVADFDASTGTMETREGRNFSVTPAGTDGNTLAWQDYAGHVHYRCTQAGSCTLSGSGISGGARLI